MMTESILILAGMAILLIGSPGPAAMALAATGSGHGFKQGLPLMSGLVAGVLLTGLLTSIGMLTLLNQWPELKLVMQIIGTGFILVMAVRMLRQPLSEDSLAVRPDFGFRSGVVMNILSPKAYAVFMLLITEFMPPVDHQWQGIVLLESVALVATLIVTSGWLLFGRLLGQLIQTRSARQKMRAVFASLMILFVMPLLVTMPG
ncbi:LysE family translocator [Oceanospirillum sediminis]|uniref:LysE family translocator n=1 Tax=Oceanospirillum sediminis TaxID=2760088 RepID=A0A839ILF0_9GAMM|nr:LysE family translocator [Oceanospirillum sediminis]MBB1485146.1 LysE family translocator [Oceanospirillum sediminis]